MFFDITIDTCHSFRDARDNAQRGKIKYIETEPKPGTGSFGAAGGHALFENGTLHKAD